jgi:single-strand DNA-binding protein
MNSFTLTAVGHLARNPELVAKGSTAYARFCLVGTDYAGKDEEGAAREVVTSLWFVAFGALGEAVARHSRKGDQLVVEARVRANNWTDKQGEKQYDHSFVVQGFRFGAPGRTKREERDVRREDGHGLHRSDERANGRDRGGVAPDSGTRAGLGTLTGLGSYTGFGTVGGANGAGVRSAISTRVPVRGNDESGAKGAADGDSARDGDEADGAGEPADTHGSAGAVESGETAESVGANEAGGAGESVGVDETEETKGSVCGDKSGKTHESTGADEVAGAEESAVSEESSRGQSAKEGTKGSTKGAAARVVDPRATTSRTREKSGVGRTGRRASGSAA